MTIGPWSTVQTIGPPLHFFYLPNLPTYTIVGDPLTSRNPTQFKYTLDYLKKVHRTTKGHLFKEKDIIGRYSCYPLGLRGGHLCPFKMDRGLQIIKKK